jgi:cytosine/adenosine deaminase-related metal-dependent hydrolase
VTGDFVIRGGLVADLQDGTCLRRDLVIGDGLIAAVLPEHDQNAPTGHAAIFDARDRLIIPGLINTHTHGHANLMKGVADRWTLEASLTNGPWLGGGRDPGIMYLSTLLGAVDMILKGCTACFDLVYEFPRPSAEGIAAVARAYSDAGMRAVLAPMIADRSLFQAIPGLAQSLPENLRARVDASTLAPGEETIAAVAAIAADKINLPAGITLAVAPTIPHHCSDSFLHQCGELADRHDLTVHMHIAESRLQAVVARQHYGASALTHLDRLGILRPGFVAAHCVWLDEDDLDLLAEHGACVAHIPASNYRLGSGIAHLRPMLDRGICVGLATDGANSSDALNMFEAMRLASFSSRVFGAPRDQWLSARETLHAATVAGAAILRLPQCGRIAQGFAADLTFLDLDNLNFVPLNDPLNQIVSAEDSSAVTDVMIGGRFVVQSKKVTTVDCARLRLDVAATLNRLNPCIAESRAFAQQLEPLVVAFTDRHSASPLPMNQYVPGARPAARG